MQITVKEGWSQLIVKSCELEDSGTFTAKILNTNGWNECKANLVVGGTTLCTFSI